jgi:hypothetical protein
MLLLLYHWKVGGRVFISSFVQMNKLKFKEVILQDHIPKKISKLTMRLGFYNFSSKIELYSLKLGFKWEMN